MTNTETCMREMRHIVSIFSKSQDFDEQWILFKAFLNTLHSLTDNDKAAQAVFRKDLTMNFSLVLRNIFHHQPKKWKFGKHDVYPTKFSLSANPSEFKTSTTYSLVIQKDTLEDPLVKSSLARKNQKQVGILEQFTKQMTSHIVVENLIVYIYDYVEKYCKDSNQYNSLYDSEPRSYVVVRSHREG